MAIKGLVLSPTLEGTVCRIGDRDGWTLHALSDEPMRHEVFVAHVPEQEAAGLPARIDNLFAAWPETENLISARWVDETGTLQKTELERPAGLVCFLMDRIMDDDDLGETTDDHPIEEMRTLLDEVDGLIRSREAASPHP